jgi:hypothetical protein
MGSMDRSVRWDEETTAVVAYRMEYTLAARSC